MTKVEAIAMYKEESKKLIKTCKANSDLVMLREQPMAQLCGYAQP